MIRTIVLLMVIGVSWKFWELYDDQMMYQYVDNRNSRNNAKRQQQKQQIHLQKRIENQNNDNNNNNEQRQHLFPPYRRYRTTTTSLDDPQQQQERVIYEPHPDAKETIAYVVTLTDCSKGDGEIPFQYAEGAAVLQYSIHRNSINRKESGSHYDYQLYAIYHPEAKNCTSILQHFGYTLLEQTFPVKVEDIRGTFLRERIHYNGCCGERELIKLVAFTLIQHPLVVLLDLDVIVLQPLDYLFDLMLHKTLPPSDHLMMNLITNNETITTIPEQIDILYTNDYGMVHASRKIKPVQGGFVVLRPNMTIFHDFIDIVTEGDFRDNGGWGGVSGKFWGAQTFQGLIPYYFHVLHPGRNVELNWCYYDNMASPSKEKDKPDCLTKTDPCLDCSKTPLSKIYLFHYTVCMKPWTCQKWDGKALSGEYRAPFCRQMHSEWFRYRAMMERSWSLYVNDTEQQGNNNDNHDQTYYHYGPGQFDHAHFYGYCRRHGHKGYIPLTESTTFLDAIVPKR